MKKYVVILIVFITLIVVIIERRRIKENMSKKYAYKTIVDRDTLTNNITKEIEQVYICSEPLWGLFKTEHFIHWAIVLKIKDIEDYYAISTTRHKILLFDRVIRKNGSYFEYINNKYGKFSIKILNEHNCIIDMTPIELLKRYNLYMEMNKNYYNPFVNNCQHIASHMYKILTGENIETISGLKMAKSCAKEYLIGPNTI